MKDQRVYAARMNVARFEDRLRDERDPGTRAKLEELLRTSREELDLARLEAERKDAERLEKRDREISRADHWRAKAEELRTTAETMAHPTSRETLTRLAQSYEVLAKQAEDRAAGGGSRQVAASGEDA